MKLAILLLSLLFVGCSRNKEYKNDKVTVKILYIVPGLYTKHTSLSGRSFCTGGIYENQAPISCEFFNDLE